jgi:hypothetical protein
MYPVDVNEGCALKSEDGEAQDAALKCCGP